MNPFSEFLDKLLDNPSTMTSVLVRGQSKQIKAMIRLTSKNYYPDEYIKINFGDGSFMLVIPGDDELYFAEQYLDQAEGVTDEMIGKQEVITYKGKDYKLDNADDYQYVLELLVGKPWEIEGECRFSDYFPVDGPTEFFSLGWLTSTGDRADIHCLSIEIDEVAIA